MRRRSAERETKLNRNETEKDYIKAESLSFAYPDPQGGAPKQALKDVSLGIRPGEFVAVVGKNGSGKSTFAKLLNLILEPTSGSLTVAGTVITPSISDAEVLELRRRVGMVFQNPDNQIIATVVEEDVAFGPENIGLPPETIRERVDGCLREMRLTDLARKEPSRLSGGQKQRVAIAGILALRPECMIFDESTAMLDPVGRKEVLAIMKRLSSEHGITVINITHLMDEAAAADRVIVLRDGELIASDSPERIFSDPVLMGRAGIKPPQCAELCLLLRKMGIDAGFGLTPEQTARLILGSFGADGGPESGPAPGGEAAS